MPESSGTPNNTERKVPFSTRDSSDLNTRLPDPPVPSAPPQPPQQGKNNSSFLKPETDDGLRPYNPLMGKEIAHVIARNLSSHVLLESEVAAKNYPYGALIESIFTKGLQSQVPQLGDDISSFPRAMVKVQAMFTFFHNRFWIEYKLEIAKYPQEEGRVTHGEGKIKWKPEIPFGRITTQAMRDEETRLEQENPPLVFAAATQFTTDAIPPDAQRILVDLPVPTPTRITGSGPDGRMSLVDVPRMASPVEKAAVEREFGGTGDGRGKE